MSLLNAIKRELRSVIEWKNPHTNELFYKWSDNGDEIKNASKLIVSPGQGCIFVYEGKVVSVFEDEGMIELETQNIPFWTTITKIMQSFESEHKVGIYFFRKTKILDQKWGTLSDIKYEDPQYKFPVSLRAFGNYSMIIEDAKLFFTQVVGGADEYYVDELRAILVNRLTHTLTDYLAEKKLSYIEIDANRNEISQDLISILQNDFDKLGFKLIDFRIEGSDFDEDTRSRINKIANTQADVYAAQSAGVSYTKLQQLNALKDAANNESGAAGMLMGVGAGNSLSNSMTDSFSNLEESKDITSRLLQLKKLFEQELISAEEYKAKKTSILQEL
ncbi:SPFH domain-containing protein [Sulfurimonas sp.]